MQLFQQLIGSTTAELNSRAIFVACPPQEVPEERLYIFKHGFREFGVLVLGSRFYPPTPTHRASTSELNFEVNV